MIYYTKTLATMFFFIKKKVINSTLATRFSLLKKNIINSTLPNIIVCVLTEFYEVFISPNLNYILPLTHICCLYTDFNTTI